MASTRAGRRRARAADGHSVANPDPVRGLRRVGRTREVLFPPRFTRLAVGRGGSNAIVISDPSIDPKEHATLERVGDRVVITDRGSAGGTWCDGQRLGPLDVRELVPGMAMRLGKVDFLVWSRRTQAVSDGLRRFFGYGREALPHLDRLLEAALHRRAVALGGPGGVGATVIARHLHRALCPNMPLVDSEDDLLAGRDILDAASLAPALARARRGTLVVRAERLPRLSEVLQIVERAARDGVWLVVLGTSELPFLVDVPVPAIAERPREVVRIVGEAIAEHATQLGVPRDVIEARDHAILNRHVWSSHDELDQSAMRLVYMRWLGGADAAQRLGLERTTLWKWADRYGIDYRHRTADPGLLVPIGRRRRRRSR
jgi:hypothetical protein